MLTNVPTVTPEDSLRDVATILERTAGNAVVVVDETGDVVGLLSESVLEWIVDLIIDAGELADGPEHGAADAAPCARLSPHARLT